MINLEQEKYKNTVLETKITKQYLKKRIWGGGGGGLKVGPS